MDPAVDDTMVADGLLLPVHGNRPDGIDRTDPCAHVAVDTEVFLDGGRFLPFSNGDGREGTILCAKAAGSAFFLVDPMHRILLRVLKMDLFHH
jgi:hypothetical protein